MRLRRTPAPHRARPAGTIGRPAAAAACAVATVLLAAGCGSPAAGRDDVSGPQAITTAAHDAAKITSVTAAISVRQVAEVLNLIGHLRDQGIAVVLISHRMPDVFAVADRIVVLRRGRKVADKIVGNSSPEEVTGLITGAITSA